MRNTQTTSYTDVYIDYRHFVHLQSTYGADINTRATSIAFILIDTGCKGGWDHCFGFQLIEAYEQGAAIGATITYKAFNIDAVNQPVCVRFA